MAEEDPSGAAWDFVASEVVERLRPTASGSPTLIAAINFGVHYVQVEKESILFDARALTLGLLAAGTPSSTAVSYHNAAFWFRSWLQERIGVLAVGEALAGQHTAFETVAQALDQNKRVALSLSVQDLCDRAVKVAQATVRRAAFDVRHLFAAMIDKGTVAEQVEQLFDFSVTVDEVRDLKRFILARIMEAPEAGETRASWEAALGLAGKGAPVPPPPGPQGPEILRFSHDSARRGGDVLETGRDVEALAKLICLKGSTPLAAAIFGGWGSGKTTFMEALDDKVEEIAREEARWVGEGAASPFVTRVVQIRFNAWQFVDANLWASLTAEFFDQLRAGGWRRAGTARHAALVERVNSHVHSLTAEAAARRKEAIEINQQVIEAKEARDDAAKAVRDAAGNTLSQAALDMLGELYEAQKENIRALGLARAGQDPTKGVDVVLEAVRSSRSILAQGRAIFRIVGRYRLVPALIGLGLMVLAAAGVWLFWSRRVDGLDWAAVAAGFGALVALVRAVLPALRLVASVSRRGADIAGDLQAADQAAVKELLGKEAALREVTAQAESAAGSADRSDRALARYLDPAGPSNPPRLLRYVLEDDPETKAFEKEIGLIGRARRLFQAVDDIIREEGDSGTAPQRIVLYIDDLDRCTEAQVYNVLQAIHLLLAFRSFAVVVGVDVKWIESALAAEFTAEKLPALSELDRRQHAVHYLEKIFQVAFWLDPLSATGDGGGSFARFVKALTQPEPTEAPSPPPSPARPDGGESAGQAQPAAGSASVATASAAASSAASSAASVAATAAQVRRSRAAFRTIELEQAEIEFLASPEIAALAGTTPRSVKRLVNVYRLVRSRLADSGVSLLGGDGELPGYPLVALTTAIETGQPVEVAVAFLDALKMMAGPSPVTVLDPPREPKEVQPELERAAVPPPPVRPKPSIAFRQMLVYQFKKAAGGESEGVAPGDDDILQVKCPALLPALARVHELRSGSVTAGELLQVARLARRFSFNRYH